MSNRLKNLHDAGQSIWLDFIDRQMLRDGELERRIRDDTLTGMTSNPTIFEKALAEGSAYDDEIRTAEGGLTSMELFEVVATSDVREACDAFAGVYRETGGADGYVSIEVSPSLADDTTGTVQEAQRLWAMVARPNVMIKAPGTDAGVAALQQLIASGINVNVTLLFAVEAYRRVIDAFMAGLEERNAAGKSVDGIPSVASFFVSRVDTEIDGRLSARAGELGEQRVETLSGKAAIANARLAYDLFREQFGSSRWKALAAAGARAQRPLWASTSTKNPAYRDVIYVEELIGPDTVNTMPPATIEAFRDHGEVRRSVDEDVEGARALLAELESLGISMKEVTDKLLIDGLASFQKSFDSLIQGLETKSQAVGRDAALR
jgi:transaldolase